MASVGAPPSQGSAAAAHDTADLLGVGLGEPEYASGSTSVTLATIVCAAVVGFALVAGVAAAREVVAAQQARKGDLVALVRARQARTHALAATLGTLRAQVEGHEQESVGASQLGAQLEQAEAAAGLTGVRGPGVQVTLADADPDLPCPSGRPEDCRIQDADLQLAVNTLLDLGAEAVAVNGERIIATTAIRNAGHAILVNYRVLTAPFVVEAVGNADDLQDGVRRSALTDKFALWRDAYGLGLSSEPAAELTLPAFRGSVRLESATPAPAVRNPR